MTSLEKLLAFLLVYENFSCYVFNSTLIIRNENDFTPAINEFTLKIISTKQQLSELVDNGFDLLPHLDKTRHRLGKGAIACLLFVGKELASMEWVAMRAEAKAAIDIYPCKVDFLNKEAYAGGVWTKSKYRGKGLHIYTYYKIYDFLRENGVRTVKSIVEVNNSAAIKSHERFAPEEKIVAKAHYLRVMGLHFWRETQYEPTTKEDSIRGNGIGGSG
ncbi:MAG: hypothetical protein ABR886_09765 [Dehalococcoidales bacterium]|jgi:hypothetical protein